MKANNITETQMMERYMPFIKKPGKSWYVLLAVLGLVGAFGIFALIMQIIYGQSVTGLRDNVVDGVYMVNFIYFIGLSYAGAMISGIFHLARVKWGKALIRIIEIASFITLLIGPVFIIVAMGRMDRIHYLFIHPRLQSPITWDLIAVTTDLIFCGVYLYMTFIKDFSLLRDMSTGDQIPKWRKKMYKVLSLGYTGSDKQRFHLNRAMDIMAAIIIPTAIIAYSLIAWLFGINLRLGWSSSIFAPYFVLTAVFSGIALIIIMMAIARKLYKISDIFTDKYFYVFGYVLLVLSLFFGYFTFSDYITHWYNSNPSTDKFLSVLMQGEFGIMYWATMILACGLPILFIGLPWFRNVRNIIITSVLVLLALYLNRYLIVVPVLETPYLPILSTEETFLNYSATWVEWSITLAGLAFAAMIFAILSRIIPIIPVRDQNEEKQKLKLFGKIMFKNL
jgi:molybdopterin-containing oxidoreductase family membrane subunit